jgi:GNAT superfamily N-acetyltransferase
MAKAELTIRSLAEGDRAAWEPLWDGYLRFYGTSAGPGLTDTTWARFHDPAEPVNALGAFTSVAAGTEQLVGIVHYIFHRSTWTTGPYCYLQDLFTAEGARGQGAGRALIEAVYRRAAEAGASRVHWLTHETNATARALYDTLAERPGFIQYRKLL